MKVIYSFLLIALLAIPTGLLAADATVSGTAEIGFRGVAIDNRSGRFDEFQNSDDGMTSRINLESLVDGRFLSLQAVSNGDNDESLELQGGAYGQYKYTLYFKEMPHNYSYDNRTFYSGIGTGTLTYNAADVTTVPAAYTPNISTDPGEWNSFDYGIVRENYGAKFGAKFASPFYVNVDLRQEEIRGTKPFAVASGVHGTFTASNFSPFGQVVELPEPIDYENTVVKVAGGYSTAKALVELAGTLSTFENKNDLLFWRNPYVTNQELNETNVLAPDNDYYNISAKTVIKQLPLTSVLAVKLSSSKMESDIPLLDSLWASTGTPTYNFITLGLNQNRFKGDVTMTNGSLSLSSKPTAKLGSRIFYDYSEKENASSHIEYENLTSTNTVENHLFEYEKQRAGIDLNYKLSKNNKLSGGYEFKTVDRHREDFDTTSDHKLYVKLKNSSLDSMTFKAKLQYLDRSADFVQPDLGGDASILLYQQRYDVADKVQTMAKLGVEFYPTDNLDLGLEYRYTLNDYDETILGLTEDSRHEIAADASYRFAGGSLLSGYAAYEMVSRESKARQYNPGESPDPAAGTISAGTFNWTQELESDYLDLGVKAELPLVTNKLKLILDYGYQESDGSNDFTTEGAAALQNVDAVQDYDLQQVEAQLIYTVSSHLGMTLGHRYEKLSYEDAQYENYGYFGVGGFDSYLLTGAYADNDYEANISYLALNYSF